jgi:hypothetical protein
MQGQETKEQNNVDWRSGEKLKKEGNENNNQFGSNEIQSGCVVYRN